MTCQQTLNLTILWRDPTPLLWTPAALHSKFTLTNGGVSCGYKSFQLYSDEACTTDWDWTGSKISENETMTPDRFAKGYDIDISTRDHLKFFLKATTASKQCVVKYEIEVCDQAVNDTSFIADLELQPNSYDGGLFVPLTDILIEPETPQCYLHNLTLLRYDSAVQSYVAFPEAIPFVHISERSDPSVS